MTNEFKNRVNTLLVDKGIESIPKDAEEDKYQLVYEALTEYTIEELPKLGFHQPTIIEATSGNLMFLLTFLSVLQQDDEFFDNYTDYILAFLAEEQQQEIQKEVKPAPVIKPYLTYSEEGKVSSLVITPRTDAITTANYMIDFIEKKSFQKKK